MGVIGNALQEDLDAFIAAGANQVLVSDDPRYRDARTSFSQCIVCVSCTDQAGELQTAGLCSKPLLQRSDPERFEAWLKPVSRGLAVTAHACSASRIVPCMRSAPSGCSVRVRCIQHDASSSTEHIFQESSPVTLAEIEISHNQRWSRRNAAAENRPTRSYYSIWRIALNTALPSSVVDQPDHCNVKMRNVKMRRRAGNVSDAVDRRQS